LDRSQRYYPRLTREAIEIFKHENIINRKEEITFVRFGVETVIVERYGRALRVYLLLDNLII